MAKLSRKKRIYLQTNATLLQYYQSVSAWLVHAWYKSSPWLWLMLPLELLYLFIITIRKKYLTFKQKQLPIPVIVVGNLTVGGTGKTPIVIWLVNFLKQHGYRPAVISRGYGSRAQAEPIVVFGDSDPLICGDEPVIIARNTQVPVIVSRYRYQASIFAEKNFAIDLIISDDGLQHYALPRQMEIAVIDGERRYGNQHCLPMGPLREPLKRLASINYLLTRGSARAGEYGFHYHAEKFVSVLNSEHSVALSHFKGRTVHAVAGIGNPDNFFNLLRAHDIQVIAHPFPDHHNFSETDLQFSGEFPILMTEKDAIKCQTFAKHDYWYLPIHVEIEPNFSLSLLSQLPILN